MAIRTYLIDDDPNDLKRLKSTLQEPPFKDTVEVIGEATSFDKAFRFLTTSTNPPDLVISDIVLYAEATHAEETSSPRLFTEVEQSLRKRNQKITFGIVFITLHKDFWAVNLLARDMVPSTFCGLIAKWDFRGMDLQEQLERRINVFKNKFEFRPTLLNGFEKWFFKPYIEDYLDLQVNFIEVEIEILKKEGEYERMKITEEKEESLRLRYRDLVAFRIRESPCAELYYQSRNGEVVKTYVKETRDDIKQDFMFATIENPPNHLPCVWFNPNADWYVNLEQNWGYSINGGGKGGRIHVVGLHVPVNEKSRDWIRAFLGVKSNKISPSER
jgi:hypothetical protein